MSICISAEFGVARPRLAKRGTAERAHKSAMSESGRALVAPLARRRVKLEAKGKHRPHKAIAKRLPAGSADLKSIPKGRQYLAARKEMEASATEAYCEAVRGATETFKESHRGESTALEHDMNSYVLLHVSDPPLPRRERRGNAFKPTPRSRTA